MHDLDFVPIKTLQLRCLTSMDVLIRFIDPALCIFYKTLDISRLVLYKHLDLHLPHRAPLQKKNIPIEKHISNQKTNDSVNVSRRNQSICVAISIGD